jgi:hypothetical protein
MRKRLQQRSLEKRIKKKKRHTNKSKLFFLHWVKKTNGYCTQQKKEKFLFFCLFCKGSKQIFLFLNCCSILHHMTRPGPILRGVQIYLRQMFWHALESGLFPLSQHPINTYRVRAVPLVLDPQLLPRW